MRIESAAIPFGRRTPLAGLGVLFLALLVGACGDGADGDGDGGGTVVVGMRTDFSGFNPVTNTSQYTGEVMKYALFTPLVQYDEDLSVRPYLAESWEMEGDTAVVFELRRDVRWHDGEPVTAEDVKFTFDLAKAPETASLLGQAYLTEVESAEVLDTFRIRFDFTRPHAQAIEDFWWSPIPRHLLEDIAPVQLRDAPFNREPVGSGPYRFVEWRANQRVVVEPNPDFPEDLGGPPDVDRIFFRIIPEPATLLTELITGGVHVDIPVQPDQAGDIEENSEVELFAFPGKTVYFLAWNTRREPFTDADVRRAMTLAVDRRNIINGLLFGHGTVATSPVPPSSPLSPDVVPLPFDPDGARELLEEAGWTDRDGDGVRENQEGQSLGFTLITSDNPLNRNVVEVVQEQLEAVGVEVELQIMEFQTMLSQFRGRDYDAALANWVLDNFQVATAPSSLFHSRWAEEEGSANRTSFADPEADRLIELGSTTTDPDEAREVWAEFTELMQREQPVTFMFWLDELAAARTDLAGVVMDPRGELQSIADWSLDGGSPENF